MTSEHCLAAKTVVQWVAHLERSLAEKTVGLKAYCSAEHLVAPKVTQRAALKAGCWVARKARYWADCWARLWADCWADHWVGLKGKQWAGSMVGSKAVS